MALLIPLTDGDGRPIMYNCLSRTAVQGWQARVAMAVTRAQMNGRTEQRDLILTMARFSSVLMLNGPPRPEPEPEPVPMDIALVLPPPPPPLTAVRRWSDVFPLGRPGTPDGHIPGTLQPRIQPNGSLLFRNEWEVGPTGVRPPGIPNTCYCDSLLVCMLVGTLAFDPLIWLEGEHLQTAHARDVFEAGRFDTFVQWSGLPLDWVATSPHAQLARAAECGRMRRILRTMAWIMRAQRLPEDDITPPPATVSFENLVALQHRLTRLRQYLVRVFFPARVGEAEDPADMFSAIMERLSYADMAFPKLRVRTDTPEASVPWGAVHLLLAIDWETAMAMGGGKRGIPDVRSVVQAFFQRVEDVADDGVGIIILRTGAAWAPAAAGGRRTRTGPRSAAGAHAGIRAVDPEAFINRDPDVGAAAAHWMTIRRERFACQVRVVGLVLSTGGDSTGEYHYTSVHLADPRPVPELPASFVAYSDTSYPVDSQIVPTLPAVAADHVARHHVQLIFVELRSTL